MAAGVDRAAASDSRQRRAFGALLAAGGVHYHVDNEVPAGAVDGTNAVFQLAELPVPASLLLFRNGLLMRQGATDDYTLDGLTVTFTADAKPEAGAELRCWYRLQV